MSNRDPGSSKPFSPANDPFAPMSDDPLATTPGQTIDQSTQSKAGDKAGQAKEKAGEAKDKASEVAGKAQEKAGEAKNKASDVAGKAQEMAGEAGEKMHSGSDKGIDAAASGLGQAAGMLRQQGEQREGTVGTAATKTADTLESASSYLQEKDTDQLMSDLESLVRRKPVESVLVAAGIGYVLSKIVS